MILSQIKPVKFGYTNSWSASGAHTLASYNIPHGVAYLLVLRIETYMMDTASGATDLYIMEGVPPGTAYWQIMNLNGDANSSENVTDTNAPSHLALDAD